MIGEDGLSDDDQAFLEFGKSFENTFLDQGFDERRSLDETLNAAWELLQSLPRDQLNKLGDDLLQQHYD